MANVSGVFYGPTEIRYSAAMITDGANSLGELRLNSDRIIPITGETKTISSIATALIRIY